MAKTNEELQKAVEHLDALIELAGLDKSESATATFVEFLDEAVIKARQAISESHGQGLSYDCRWIIAETLLQRTGGN
jgi:hypothetical protein